MRFFTGIVNAGRRVADELNALADLLRSMRSDLSARIEHAELGHGVNEPGEDPFADTTELPVTQPTAKARRTK